MESTHSSSTLFSVPGTTTLLITVAMATGIIYRRFAGQSCRASAFSTTTKVREQKMLFGKAEESQSAPKMGKGLRLWVPPQYRVSFNPSTYPVAKCLHHGDASKGLGDGSSRGESAAVSPRRIQNSYGITRSQRLSDEKNMLPELEDDDELSGKLDLMHPLKESFMKDDSHDDDTEAYIDKETTRMFQKQRPEYRSLCYNREEFSQPLSIEESKVILQKVSVLKSKIRPETIAEYLFRLSCLPAEQHRVVLSNFRFGMLCHYGIRKIQMFDTADLIKILKAFGTLAIPPSHSMLKKYEQECCRRAWNMTLNQLLLVADLWRYLGRSVPAYLKIMLSYVNLHWKELTLPQLVQLIYIIGEGRSAPQELMQKLDILISTHLESLNLEEVGVVCLGYFKSKNDLSEQTMKKIGDKVCAHMVDISNHALVNILKLYRFTYTDHVDFMQQLGQVVPDRIQTMSLQGIMHVALACSALHFLDERLMNAVAFSVPSKLAYCRCKDIAKLLWSFGTLNYEPPNAEEFYASLEEELHVKLHEFQKYPEHLISALVGLALAKRFHYDLIDYALSPKFISLSREGKYCPNRDFLTLDGTVEIECPDYTGNRLTPQLRQEMADEIYTSARKDLYNKLEITTAVSVLEDLLGGPQYVKKHLILPHNRTLDLEIHLGSDRNPLPFNSEAVATEPLTLKQNGVSLTDDLMNKLLQGKISSQTLLAGMGNKPEKCAQKKVVQQSSSLSAWNHLTFSDGVPLTGSLLNALTNSKTSSGDPDTQLTEQLQERMKLAIQVSSRNHYCYRSKHLLGLHSMKRRQLRQIGYVIVEVPFWEWFPLLKNSYSDKLSYLYHKVFGCLGERKPTYRAESEF